MDKIYVETDRYEQTREYKICPRTGEKIYKDLSLLDYKTGEFMSPQYCFATDCSSVKKIAEFKTCEYDGRRISYACEAERRVKEDEIRRQNYKDAKKNELYHRFMDSAESAKNFDYPLFVKKSETLNKMILRTARPIRELTLNPYLEDGESFIVYFIKDGAPYKIQMVHDLCGAVSKSLKDLYEDPGCMVGYVRIFDNEYGITLLIALRIMHKLDVSKMLSLDDPVYVSSTAIKRYLDASYGITWRDFKKILEKHLEITEIENGGNTIYLKPELDEIIRRDMR